MTLSSALCRPTSSRRQRRLPSLSKRPDEWSPPVRSKMTWFFLRVSGRARSVLRSMTHLLSISGYACLIESIDVLPQTPQLEEMAPKRLDWISSRGIESLKRIRIVFSGLVESLQRLISLKSLLERAMPSVTMNPAASSSSCPGVRMVTTKGSLPIRISRGSSIATSSLIVLALPSAWRRTTAL